MPRRSRSSSPSRTQTRQSSTSTRPAAYPPANHTPNSHVPANLVPRQPGMFGQMASIAGGVAVGSTVGNMMGNAIGSIFGGGGSEPVQSNSQPPQQAYNHSNENLGATACAAEFKAFTECMEKNTTDISSCQIYLDMLKQCRGL